MLAKISDNRVFSGCHQQWQHDSQVLGCQMRFAIYLPETASEHSRVPVLYWLSGLTCTDENFMQKAGALRMASKLGMAIVAADTSPRGEGVPDEPAGAYDLGLGAGFYVNATQSPWEKHYQMYDYITQELPSLIEAHFPVTKKKSISGHSMGGHGALTIALKNPGMYESCSAFSPIVNPVAVPWGQKAFQAYFGTDQVKWAEHDACHLIEKVSSCCPILIDQGDADAFLQEQLKTEHFISAAGKRDFNIQVRMQQGYDHSYYFISSFIDEHLIFHANYLVE